MRRLTVILAAAALLFGACSASNAPTLQPVQGQPTSRIIYVTPAPVAPQPPVQYATPEPVVVEDSPVAAAPGDDISNPIPLGHQGTVGDWTITVTKVVPNANAMIAAANMFNEPPAQGGVFFAIYSKAVYHGKGSGHLDTGLNFRAATPEGTIYTSFGDSCGVLPDPNLFLNEKPVFAGGTVAGWSGCWAIARGDAARLTLFVENPNGMTWFALR